MQCWHNSTAASAISTTATPRAAPVSAAVNQEVCRIATHHRTSDRTLGGSAWKTRRDRRIECLLLGKQLFDVRPSRREAEEPRQQSARLRARSAVLGIWVDDLGRAVLTPARDRLRSRGCRGVVVRRHRIQCTSSTSGRRRGSLVRWCEGMTHYRTPRRFPDIRTVACRRGTSSTMSRFSPCSRVVFAILL